MNDILNEAWFNAWMKYYINKQINESKWYRE